MARFTISDCMENIENRYELTLTAAVRARQIEHGEQTFLDDNENDKPTVLALREIASRHVDTTILKELSITK